MANNAFYALTNITILFAGLLSWVAMVLGLLWLDTKFIRAHLVFVFSINLVLASALAALQLLLLNFVANLFTGFGLGYSMAFALLACGAGAFAASIAATGLNFE